MMEANDLYLQIAKTLDQGPLTAPRAGNEISRAFIEFLKLVYPAEQAEIVRHLSMPYKFLSAAQLAAAAGRDEAFVRQTLDALAARCAIIGVNGLYCLPLIPMLLNNHHFYASLKPDDVAAAKLYQQFFIKEGFYKYYESSEKGTPVMRVIPVMRSIEPRQKVLDTEEAHRVIRDCREIAMVPCPCRTRAEKLGSRECRDRNPIGSCLMLNMSALYFEKAGLGKKVSAEQAIKYFDEMQELGLVGITENYDSKNEHEVICLCCDCCCSQVRGRTRWQNMYALAPSNFVPEASEECILCGTCIDRCFFGAIKLDEEKGRSVVDAGKCVGCGVCAIGCEQEALRLVRVERSQPFAGPRELYKRVAIENREERKERAEDRSGPDREEAS